MTISATTQGLRPGVCTSTSRPSTPFTGQLIFETDTNRLAVWNGTSWVFLADADTPSGLQLVKTQTVGTAVSSVTVTDAFSSEFDNYKIMWVGGTLSAQSDIVMQLGSSTASYFNWMVYGAYSGTTVTGASNNNASNWTWIGGGNTDHAVVDVNLYGPFLSKHTYMNNNGFYSPNAEAGFTSGVHKVATSYTSFILDPAGSTTMTGGTIRVYGYRNS